MFNSIITDAKAGPNSKTSQQRLRVSFARTKVLSYRPDTFLIVLSGQDRLKVQMQIEDVNKRMMKFKELMQKLG